KEGDSVSLTFKGQTQVVKQNEEAIYGALIAMGQMTGVAGQNAEMMTAMNGMVANNSDAFDAFQLSIGDKLTPVFKFFLTLVGQTIEWLTDLVNSTDPLIKVFQDVFYAVGDLVGAFADLVSDIFPKVQMQGKLVDNVMNVIAIAFRVV